MIMMRPAAMGMRNLIVRMTMIMPKRRPADCRAQQPQGRELRAV